MTGIDWFVVALYVVIALALGFVFARKASHNTTDFFVAGRSLPWWIAGTSLVATTFSTDTPLYVAGLSRNEGIQGNWFWWSAAIGQTATIFFFARLWRRTKVLTEVEFIRCRYDASPQRSVLRVFKVLFDGVMINCVIMASVTIAASKVIQAVMGLGEDPLVTWAPVAGGAPWINLTQTDTVLIILGFCALSYSMASGLYGVVYTDLVQFVLAMVGTIWLAVVSFNAVSEGGGGFVAGLSAAPGFRDGLLGFAPDLSLSSMDLIAFTFMCYVFVAWWPAAPGTGYFVQRLLATRSERDSMLAFLWYNFCHYVVRPWPWIIVGLASMVFFPDLTGDAAEHAFPEMINLMLGPGIKGIMVAAMLAAYMSTLDTQLNWGASYLVNDLYQPFIRKSAAQKELVLVSRLAMAALMVMALLATTQLEGILKAYKYLTVITSGLAAVLILRWYWWRVTAWSEIAAIVGALLIGNACELWLASPVDAAGMAVLDAAGRPVDWFAYRLLVTTFGTAAVWVAVTLFTARAPSAKAVEFCRDIRPPGAGWRLVRRREGIKAERGAFGLSVIGWFASMGFIFSMLLGVGAVIFSRWTDALICLAVALVSAYILKRVLVRALSDPPAGGEAHG
jgi:solute:Na+ symporter, SSS family